MSRTRKQENRNQQGKPPQYWRNQWRREARVLQNRTLRNCKDLEELQIESKIQKLSSVYDWY